MLLNFMWHFILVNQMFYLLHIMGVPKVDSGSSNYTPLKIYLIRSLIKIYGNLFHAEYFAVSNLARNQQNS